MVVLIVGVGLAGYAALRLVGQQRGAVMLGLLGGLVSSTATTLAFSRDARASDTMVPVAAIVIMVANLVVLVRLGLGVLAAVLAPGVLMQLAPVLLGGLIAGGLGAVYGVRLLRRAAQARLSPSVHMAHRLCAFTAMRIGNVVQAEWREFRLDDEQPVWIIPRAKMKVTDRDIDHRVPLCPEIVAELRQWREVFGGRGCSRHPPATSISAGNPLKKSTG